MRCISEFLSIDGQYYVPIDYYISIDLAGVPKFASALGGIKLTLDVDFPGIGNEGDEVVWTRKIPGRHLENRKQVGGELNRVSHEQQYLIAVAKKIKDKGAVESAPRALHVIHEIYAYQSVAGSDCCVCKGFWITWI